MIYGSQLKSNVKTIKDMKIDFNNVRKQALNAYDRLATHLNNSKGYEGYMLVDPNEIQGAMDDLRTTIGAIAMSYDPDGDEDLKCVYPEAPYTMVSFEFNAEPEND
jgi:hypothetical protein